MLRPVIRLSDDIGGAKLPLGTIVAYYKQDQPENFLICDGRSCAGYELESIMSNTPDLRGKFIRMVGGNAAGFGIAQEDAIRNITGTFKVPDRNSEYDSCGTGCFQSSNASGWSAGDRSDSTLIKFDASLSVPTSNEVRPVNVAMNYIIYAGKKKS